MGTYFTKLNFVSVPIRVGYKFGNNFFGYTNLGAIPSFLISAKYILEADAIKFTSNTIVTNDYKRLHIAGFADVGMGWNLNKTILLNLNLRYQYAFTNSVPLSLGLFTFHQNAINLSMGLSVNL